MNLIKENQFLVKYWMCCTRARCSPSETE